MKWVGVFCGANAGHDEVYREAARAVGHALADNGWGLVYGGGGSGMMGAVADAVLAGGGNVIGVIPAPLVARELAHPKVQDMRIVETMHQRKALMADLSDGFIALPGGFGTLDELCEILTWAQLGMHAKPCGVLDVAGFFAPLLAHLDHAVREGFLLPVHRNMVLVDTAVAPLLEKMKAYAPPTLTRWINRDQT